jgi:uncharacterized protein
VDSYFFDSSGVVKRYVTELGSAWVLGITDPLAANDIYVVHITGVEVVSALVRKVPSLPPLNLAQAITEFKYDLQQQYQRVAVTGALVVRAMSLAEAHRLRGYDAVQLAAALQVLVACRALGAPLTFVSADVNLNAAAAAEGLPVDNPVLHP